MRRALVMASNGSNPVGVLRYALDDAERIARCLSGPSCGFDVQRVPTGADNWQALQQLVDVAETCESSDTFVCYFSGHGWLNEGTLYLLWDNTTLDRLLGTSVSVSVLVEAMKGCRAHSKLLILDCCHAGAVAQGFKGPPVPVKDVVDEPDNFVVLMASDRLQRARELESLKGSFLTSTFCKALTDDVVAADKNSDNRISVEDIRHYLEDEAKRHNSEHPELYVPVPYIFGQLRGGDFFLTVGESDWKPYEFEWLEGTILVVTPTPLMRNDRVLCVAKYPVTNAQWGAAGFPEPKGKHRNAAGAWQGPFFPWRDDHFKHPQMPVVCVSYEDAKEYCAHLQPQLDEEKKKSRGEIPNLTPGDVRLPTTDEWVRIAFGTINYRVHSDTWLRRSKVIHHKAQAPAAIDKSGERTNPLGISDMIGNVWEWCGRSGPHPREPLDDLAELRGGGFLDDMAKDKPFKSASELEEGSSTRRSDVGFRIVVEVLLQNLPEDIRAQVEFIRKVQEGYGKGIEIPGVSQVTPSANSPEVLIPEPKAQATSRSDARIISALRDQFRELVSREPTTTHLERLTTVLKELFDKPRRVIAAALVLLVCIVGIFAGYMETLPPLNPPRVSPPVPYALGEIGICGTDSNRHPDNMALDREKDTGSRNLMKDNPSLECWVRVRETGLPDQWQASYRDYYYSWYKSSSEHPTVEYIHPNRSRKHSGVYSARLTRSSLNHYFGSVSYDMIITDAAYITDTDIAYHGRLFEEGESLHASVWYQTRGDAKAKFAVLSGSDITSEEDTITTTNLTTTDLLPFDLWPLFPYPTWTQACLDFVAHRTPPNFILAVQVQGDGTLWVDDFFVGRGRCPPLR